MVWRCAWVEGVKGREWAKELPNEDGITTTDHMTTWRRELDLRDGNRVANEDLYTTRKLVYRQTESHAAFAMKMGKIKPYIQKSDLTAPLA